MKGRVLMQRQTGPAPGSFRGPGHGFGVEGLVEVLFGYLAFFLEERADGLAGLEGLLGHPGGLVVADERV